MPASPLLLRPERAPETGSSQLSERTDLTLFNGTGGFTAPTFTTNGGGNSTIQYDSLAVSRAMGAVGAASGGMREY